MLTADYEQAYISSFAKIFTMIKNEYEVLVKNSECENYEIEIKNVNKEEIKDYLSICFQKQNGALIIIADKKIDEEITKKLVKNISLALNKKPIASYNFKDLSEFIVYHFEYVRENKIIDNEKILEDLKKLGKIENLVYDINITPYFY